MGHIGPGQIVSNEVLLFDGGLTSTSGPVDLDCKYIGSSDIPVCTASIAEATGFDLTISEEQKRTGARLNYRGMSGLALIATTLVVIARGD